MCVKLIFFLCLTQASGKPSFTVLLDTTQSMLEEIDVIKQNIVSAVNFTKETLIDNYNLVPFNDPDVGPSFTSATLDGLITSLYNISVQGGHDCPENCLAGIQKALEISNSDSYIFMFTDAYANDDSKFNEIADLCRRTRSQVTIFLSGSCFSTGTKQVGSIDVYYDIAKACSGNIFQLDPTNLRQAFRFMKELVQVEWSDISTYDPFNSYKELPFTVDSATTDLLISVYGNQPELQIMDSHGDEIALENIVDARHAKVVRIKNMDNGENTLKVNCHGPTSVTFYKRRGFPFQYGFFTKIPKSFRETSRRPIPGWRNYILLEIPLVSNIQLNAIKLQSDGNTESLSFEKVNEDGYYLASSVFEPQKTYKLTVSGEDTSNNQEIKETTKIIKPQQPVSEPQWTQLTLEIIEPANKIITIEFGENATVACKVTGYPKPNIWWEDADGAILKSEDVLLEVPNVHISYVATENLTKNGTIYCKAKNARGEEIETVEVFIKRTFYFNVLSTPEDETFEYGTEGKLHCQVDAYPTANIKWYHNGTFLQSTEEENISTDNHMILIKNIDQDDAGEYKCQIENGIEKKTYTAVVSVTGLEAPEIEIQTTEHVLKLGDWTDINCKITKGKPYPNVTWRYKSNYGEEFDDLPDVTITDGPTLKFPGIKLEHDGLYRCEAVNVQGQDYRDVTIRVQSEPKINNDHHEVLTVNEGDMVALPCEVKAVPKASVIWELTQDDVTVHLDDRQTTDVDHTLRFEALWKDSGNYRCIAENVAGRAEKTYSINVLVPPYIQTPSSKTVTVKTGASVTLSCNILFGNPVPSTKWEFIANRSPAIILNRNASSLHLTDISRAHEGIYMCLAENGIGTDIVRIHLKVK